MSKLGILIPLITPLDHRGNVCQRSLQRLLAQSRHLAAGYIPALTSGEGWRLTAAQWESMVRWTRHWAGDKSVIAGIERPNTEEVLDYIGRAERLGADGIMVTSPFGSEVSQGEILEHYRRIHQASRLPIYIYNESALSSNETRFETLRSIAELPRVLGIKDSPETPRSADEIQQLQAHGLSYFTGWEENLAGVPAADGNVVSLANLEPALCRAALLNPGAAMQEEVDRLSETYRLDAEDWYRHVKTELAGRGVITSALTADETVPDTGGGSEQKQLYLYNRARIQDPLGTDPALLAFEQRWILSHLQGPLSQGPSDLSGLQKQLTDLIASEQRDIPDSADYVARQMTRQEFRTLVQEFAVDGLTEAQSFYYVLPRLAFEAQMPMLRIVIDEFGAGNPRRAHTSLYIRLLEELEMPTEVGAYIQRLDPASFAFVNLFYWLALRADDPSYFAGAITYLETAIPAFFECYVQACERLGIAAHHYYSEHQHIDAFHAQEGQRLLRAMDASGSLDAAKAWAGARLASEVTADAFENAVSKARGKSESHRWEVADSTVEELERVAQ